MQLKCVLQSEFYLQTKVPRTGHLVLVTSTSATNKKHTVKR